MEEVLAAVGGREGKGIHCSHDEIGFIIDLAADP